MKAARERAGLTQAQLAAKLRTDLSCISRWEHDRNTPTPTALVGIESILGPLDSGDTSRVTGQQDEPSRSQP